MNDNTREMTATHAAPAERPIWRRLFTKENAAVGVAVTGGVTVAAAGVTAVSAAAGVTAILSGAGAAVGGIAGALVGSSIGLATGGIGMAATVPLSAIGATLGGAAGALVSAVGSRTCKTAGTRMNTGRAG